MKGLKDYGEDSNDIQTHKRKKTEMTTNVRLEKRQRPKTKTFLYITNKKAINDEDDEIPEGIPMETFFQQKMAMAMARGPAKKGLALFPLKKKEETKDDDSDGSAEFEQVETQLSGTRCFEQRKCI